jgi:hypothetical protein
LLCFSGSKSTNVAATPSSKPNMDDFRRWRQGNEMLMLRSLVVVVPTVEDGSPDIDILVPPLGSEAICS